MLSENFGNRVGDVAFQQRHNPLHKRQRQSQGIDGALEA
jgi:hypothetical protein